MGGTGYLVNTAWRAELASPKQHELIRTLVRERWHTGNTPDERWSNFLDTHDERLAHAKKGDASDMIGWLKGLPKRADAPAPYPVGMPPSVPVAAPAPVIGSPVASNVQGPVGGVSTHTHRPTQKPGWFPEPGTFYLVDHKIYKVFMGRRPYAKELVLYPHDTDPKKKKGRFEYVPGAIRMIPGPEYALTPQQAVILGHAFGFCAYCGTELDDPKSVERGVGPHCWKKYHLPALARSQNGTS